MIGFLNAKKVGLAVLFVLITYAVTVQAQMFTRKSRQPLPEKGSVTWEYLRPLILNLETESDNDYKAIRGLYNEMKSLDFRLEQQNADFNRALSELRVENESLRRQVSQFRSNNYNRYYTPIHLYGKSGFINNFSEK